MVPALSCQVERSAPDGSVVPMTAGLSSPAVHWDGYDLADCPAHLLAVAPDGLALGDPADWHSDGFPPTALSRAGSLPASRLDDSSPADLRPGAYFPDGYYPDGSHSGGLVDSHRAGLVDSAADDLRSVGSHPAGLHPADWHLDDLHPDGCYPVG